MQEHGLALAVMLLLGTRSGLLEAPASIFVARASKAFSTSSFTAVPRSKMTCPEQIRCTELLSMGLMEVIRCLCTSVSTCDREQQCFDQNLAGTWCAKTLCQLQVKP